MLSLMSTASVKWFVSSSYSRQGALFSTEEELSALDSSEERRSSSLPFQAADVLKQKERFKEGNAPKYFNQKRLSQPWLADLRKKHPEYKKVLFKRKGLVIESYRQDSRDPALQDKLMKDIKAEYDRRDIKFSWQVLNTTPCTFKFVFQI